MSPSVTRRGERFGTSTPTACLPGIGARIRISVVASAYERSSRSAATFETFVPGRELELVARHARARDLARRRRLDAELRRACARAGRRRARRVLLRRAAAPASAEDRAVGEPVLGVLRRRLEHALDALGVGLVGLVGGTSGASPSGGSPDEVGIRLGPVEQPPRRWRAPRLRRKVERLLGLRLERGPVERAARLRAGLADDMAGAAEDRARRGAAHEERAAERGARRRRSPRPCRRSARRARRRARARSSRRCPCRAGS